MPTRAAIFPQKKHSASLWPGFHPYAAAQLTGRVRAVHPAHAMRPVFETVRMYRRATPPPVNRIYGVTSLELG